MKYILDTQFMNASIKQVRNMIHLRIARDLEANDYIWKFEDFTGTQHQRNVEKAKKVIQDCSEWLSAARPLLSDDLWNSIISEDVIGSNGKKHCVVDIYHTELN
jgi:hypothetical protein